MRNFWRNLICPPYRGVYLPIFSLAIGGPSTSVRAVIVSKGVLDKGCIQSLAAGPLFHRWIVLSYCTVTCLVLQGLLPQGMYKHTGSECTVLDFNWVVAAGQAPSAWAIGARCQAYSSLDGNWYTATVTGVSAADHFIVQYRRGMHFTFYRKFPFAIAGDRIQGINDLVIAAYKQRLGINIGKRQIGAVILFAGGQS
ncbi:MAG: hypothetical protein EOP49_17360 [Sphingobacteriales bacterium]|nr:MAG: hypothetical protein EOP49_17360 [Sphingobacteriales bacterium]